MSGAYMRSHSPSEGGGQITPGHWDCLKSQQWECFCQYGQIYYVINNGNGTDWSLIQSVMSDKQN